MTLTRVVYISISNLYGKNTADVNFICDYVLKELHELC